MLILLPCLSYHFACLRMHFKIISNTYGTNPNVESVIGNCILIYILNLYIFILYVLLTYFFDFSEDFQKIFYLKLLLP